MKLNEKQPYATVHGHPVYVYQQGDKFFNGTRDQVDENGQVIDVPSGSVTSTLGEGSTVQTDGVATATAFLKNLLGGGPMAKAILFQQAEGMQLAWDDVKKAAAVLKVFPSQRNKVEHWQLPEGGN